MGKTKILVTEVLPCAGNLDVAVVLMDDGIQTKELHLCVPKSCNIADCIGEEVYYEFKNGKVSIKAIYKPSAEVITQHYGYEAEGN